MSNKREERERERERETKMKNGVVKEVESYKYLGKRVSEYRLRKGWRRN